jgi:L-ascorbate metabolism protein UlaG (beta-lactamase superfamily)
VDITWLGHSCFRIKGSQAVIITDPFPPDLGYTLGKQTADIVTVSHQHPSHSYVEGIGGEYHVVNGPGEYEISGVLIIGVATFHDTQRGQVRGKNTAYVMEIDGISVCHLGDLGHVPTSEQLEEMGNIDMLLLPVGGGSTISAAISAEVIRQIEPNIVIPMHYKTPAIKRDLDTVDVFLKEMGRGQVEPRPRLNVSKSNLPISTEIIVLTA